MFKNILIDPQRHQFLHPGKRCLLWRRLRYFGRCLLERGLGFGAGNGGSATVNVASLALATLLATDVLACVLVGVQTGGPEDLTATVSFG